MEYKITGRQLDIGDALQVHVRDTLEPILEKYSARPTGVSVIFSKDAHEYVAECVVQLSSGLNTAAKGRTGEIYAAFDDAAEKISKQLRRYKRRLKNHHNERATPVEFLGATSYILAGERDNEESERDGIDPIIIAETGTTYPSFSVGEAVMQMDLASSNVLVFLNEKTNGLNVVYRRDDGNIGWIEPQSA